MLITWYLYFYNEQGKFAEFDCKISFQKEIDVGKYYYQINNVYKEKDTKYDLIGATFVYNFYRGHGHGSHTVAFCKTYNNGNYFQFNDKDAKESNLKEINGKIPYILFDERRKKKYKFIIIKLINNIIDWINYFNYI